MLDEDGAKLTRDKLIRRSGYTTGFERLRQAKRLDLSIEAIVLLEPWDELFSGETLSLAKKCLEKVGYVLPDRRGTSRLPEDWIE